MSVKLASAVASINKSQLKSEIPDFRVGDTVRVHVRIVEGAKERIQVFQGIVIRRRKRNSASASFTVRKVSYSVGVERTFLLHSPRVEKIEVISRGVVRRAKLFYLREMKGKAARVRSQLVTQASGEPEPTPSEDEIERSEETESSSAAAPA